MLNGMKANRYHGKMSQVVYCPCCWCWSCNIYCNPAKKFALRKGMILSWRKRNWNVCIQLAGDWVCGQLRRSLKKGTSLKVC